ncbi:MAG: phytoene desaturase family protein [candidate division KSB1 bacterium]|jgi:phytoene desaturase|nr:phytoene desaturase family protein [candidate division KSB1 bacterium]
MRKKCIVIGGGLGGLTAAIRLANHGYEVELFEQNNHLGGKMNAVTMRGYRFDTGPSLLTLPFVVDDLYASMDLDRKDFLDFIPVDPICRYFWDSGTRLDASSDVDFMKRQIASVSREDAGQLEAYFRYTQTIYNITAHIFLFTPIHEIRKLLNVQTLKSLLRLPKIDATRTVHEGVSRFFSHPETIQLFDRYATYNGSDPYRAPATLNIIPYVEYKLGCFYVKGGMYRLVEELASLARRAGVVIHLDARVEKILHSERRVQGIAAGGEKIAADAVMSNADVVHAYDQLIDGFDRSAARLHRLEPSLSGFVFLWGVKGKESSLAHHNIFFSGDYKEEFNHIFQDKTISEDPTVYVSITGKRDPDHAPSGCENWFVLVNTPYLDDTLTWKEDVQRLRTIVLDKIKRSGFDIADRIETEHTISPQDFYDLYSSNRGSIYGISSNSRTAAFRRPPNRNRDIRGLYFAGGSSHPGGGVPLAILSGQLSAELITDYLN